MVVCTATYTRMVSLATFTATFLGTTSPAYTARYIFDGTNKIVTINIPETRFNNTGASTSAFLTSNLPIPAEIRPSTIINIPARIISGNTFLPCGMIVIYTSGAIAIGVSDASNLFISGASVGTYLTNSITYMV